MCMIASSYEMKRSGTLHFSIGDDLLGRFKIIFGGKEGISLRPNVYHTILICISNHAFLICFKYKCHIINILACSVCTEKYRTSVFFYKPRPTGSVCTEKTSVRYFSVQTSRSVNKKLLIVRLKWSRNTFK